MKKNLISLSACLTALIAVSFSAKIQSDPPDCSSILIYIKVTGTFTNCDLAAQTGFVFPIPNDGVHVDIKRASEYPFGCTNSINEICAIGYDNTEIQLNPITNHWELKSGKTSLNYRCCIRRTYFTQP